MILGQLPGRAGACAGYLADGSRVPRGVGSGVVGQGTPPRPDLRRGKIFDQLQWAFEAKFNSSGLT